MMLTIQFIFYQPNMAHLLTQQQVLEVQVELLSAIEQKHSLSNYYTTDHNDQSTSYKSSSQIKVMLKQQFGINEVKGYHDNSNSIFKVLTAVFMRLFFTNNNSIRNEISEDEGGGRIDLLEHLKCTLYSPALNLENIINSPISNLNTNDMKKIIVELFQVLKYNDGPVQPILDKYLIVQEIFILFFRTVLINILQVNTGQRNYQARIQSNKAIQNLLDYFDITYQFRKGLYILYEDNLYIYVHPESSEIVYGQYKSLDLTLKDKFEENRDFHFEENELDFLQEDKKQTIMSTPTPFFAELNEEQINFSQKQGGRKNRRKESLQLMKQQLSQRISESNKLAIKEQEEEDDKQIEIQHKISNILTAPYKQRKMSQYVSNRSSLQKDYDKMFHRQSQESKNSNKNVWESSIPSSPEAGSIGGHQKNFDALHHNFLCVDRRSFQDQEKMAIHPTKDSQSMRSQKEMNKFKRSGTEEQYNNISKSNIFQSEDTQSKYAYDNRGYKNINDEYDGSIGTSCACSEIKSKKNSLQSNVLDLHYTPDFKKKEYMIQGSQLQCSNSPRNSCKIQNKTEKDKKYKLKNAQKLFSKKMPDFIFKRPPSYSGYPISTRHISSKNQSFSVFNDQKDKSQPFDKHKVSLPLTKKGQNVTQKVPANCVNPNSFRIPNHIHTEPCSMLNNNKLRSYRQHYRIPSEYTINTKFLADKMYKNIS